MTPGARLPDGNCCCKRPARILGPIIVTIAAGVPDRRRRDVDNLGKAVLDLLTAHQVIEDDAKVMSLTSRWDAAVTPGRVQIAVARADHAPRSIAYSRILPPRILAL